MSCSRIISGALWPSASQMGTLRSTVASVTAMSSSFSKGSPMGRPPFCIWYIIGMYWGPE